MIHVNRAGRLVMLTLAAWSTASNLSGQTQPSVDPLDGLNKAIETMAERVSPTVVQVLASKYKRLSFQHVPGSAMSVEVLRGTQLLTFSITPAEIEEPSDRLADLKDLSQRQIPTLGIMAMTLDKRTAEAIGRVGLASGAVVIARVANPRGADIGLQPGDLIHELNGRNIFSVDDLRDRVAELKPGDSVCAAGSAAMYLGCVY